MTLYQHSLDMLVVMATGRVRPGGRQLHEGVQHLTGAQRRRNDLGGTHVVRHRDGAQDDGRVHATRRVCGGEGLHEQTDGMEGCSHGGDRQLLRRRMRQSRM